MTIGEQRRLFRRWTTDDTIHPHEAAVGLLAMLHALTNAELRGLRALGLDARRRTLRVERRQHPVPLDPASLAAITACLDHRASLDTRNPHLVVTKVTKPRETAASPAYMTHLLDPAGVSIKKTPLNPPR